ncbi:Mitochondrial import inner membrane translocase subunit [Musa troglodytarum]|uniref:Mitochondrial import inner membrane translocase subunit n=1 Tax=Musa troglodytarum TaxID=320322 RepID=A0A9E7GB91_9LILI|nr:Mitochondrial import inner membrane translocase subunit [Musa troglodytarum]
MAAKNGASSIEKEQIFGMAEKEMEYRVDLFNRLTQTCFQKCIEKRYKESELNMGENSCIDRCVSKYWQARYLELQTFVTNLVGQLLGSNRPPM